LIFSKLGIYGFTSAQETAILSGMLSGEPILLVGPPGVAKTELVKVIGSSLRESSKRKNPSDPSKWFSYQIYDASKLNFEDLVGYPSVADLQKDPPKVSYIPTASSIWNKDLIAFDELNRCSEDRQSNLFEVIRSRKLHGIDTHNTFIFSTINPFGDTGTIEMGGALVDRHTMFIRIGKFENLGSTDRKHIIKRIGDVDSVGFKYWSAKRSNFDVSDDLINASLADIGDEISRILKKAYHIYEQLKEESEASLVELVDTVVTTLPQQFNEESDTIKKECTISGRRAASIYRAILSTRAVELVKSQETTSVSTFTSTIINTMKLCLPIGIGGECNEGIVTRAEKFIETSVRALWPTIKSKSVSIDFESISKALTTNDPIILLQILLSSKQNKRTKAVMLGKLFDKSLYTGDSYSTSYGETGITKYSAMQSMLDVINKSIPGFIPNHLVSSLPVNNLFDNSTTPIAYPSRFLNIYDTLIKKYSSDPILSYALKLSLFYYSTKSELKDDEAIKIVLRTSDICQSLDILIQENKEHINEDSTSEQEISFPSF
jgi:hypothetical protein